MNTFCQRLVAPVTLVVVAAATGCPPVAPPPDENEGEVITTVELTFTPQGGGADLVFAFADPENDGDPVVDDIVLADADDYDLGVRFLNELADPAEDISAEVADEAADHQVLIFGSAVSGPAAGPAAAPVVTHAYADTDDNGLPVGLANTIVTDLVGGGAFSVLLRHMPPENGAQVKGEATAADFASGGEAAIGGSTDANVTFDLRVE